MESAKHRNYTYDNLKWFLIVLVVIGHCIVPYLDRADSFKSAFCFIYFFHMPAFIFISGLFSKKCVENSERIKERICYFITLFCLLQIFILCLRLVLFKDASFSLLTVEGLPWFMFAMACYHGLTYYLSRFNHKYILFVALLLGSFSGYDYSIGDHLVLSRIIVYYPLFFLGYMLDPQELEKSLNHYFFRLAGLSVILFYAWFCLVHLDVIWKVKPLFSGRNSFKYLPYAAFGCLYRFGWYALIICFILFLIAVAPKKKSIITAFGQRTIQVYFLHYSALYLLMALGIFDKLIKCLPAGIWQISFLGAGVLVSMLFSLKVWKYPFDLISIMTKRSV